MSAPRKYDQEFRDRAVRLYRDRLEREGGSLLGARRHVGGVAGSEASDFAEALGGGG
jgi:transposase